MTLDLLDLSAMSMQPKALRDLCRQGAVHPRRGGGMGAGMALGTRGGEDGHGG